MRYISFLKNKQDRRKLGAGEQPAFLNAVLLKYTKIYLGIRIMTSTNLIQIIIKNVKC
tara:strand:- start:1912 stop:2085 length:174 start_codon:yes stop_codon:yes gene_type:complete